jgi:hypothetical protein
MCGSACALLLHQLGMVVCRQQTVNAAAQAVGSMWEAAAACNASKNYLPLLVLEFLRVSCDGVPGVVPHAAVLFVV